MRYFVALVSPATHAKALEDLDPEWRLSEEKHARLARQLGNLPLQVEHKGVFAAVDRLQGRNAQVTRDSVVKELTAISEHDATKSIIGRTIRGWTKPGSGLYITAYISDRFESVSFLVHRGILGSVSLTTPWDHSEGWEVSLTNEPARPHCHILRTSTNLEVINQYLADLDAGNIRDDSADLTKPVRVMAASKTAMAASQEAAAAPAPSTSETSAAPSTSQQPAVQDQPSSSSDSNESMEIDVDEVMKTLGEASPEVQQRLAHMFTALQNQTMQQREKLAEAQKVAQAAAKENADLKAERNSQIGNSAAFTIYKDTIESLYEKLPTNVQEQLGSCDDIVQHMTGDNTSQIQAASYRLFQAASKAMSGVESGVHKRKLNGHSEPTPETQSTRKQISESLRSIIGMTSAGNRVQVQAASKKHRAGMHHVGSAGTAQPRTWQGEASSAEQLDKVLAGF